MGRYSVLYGLDVSLVEKLDNKKLSAKEYRNKTIIVSLAKGVLSVNKCSETHEITRKTINDISKNFLIYGVSSLLDKVGVKRNVKITDDMHNFIDKVIQTDTPEKYGYTQRCWSIKILHQVLNSVYYYDVTYTTIFFHVHQLGYKFKVPSRTSCKYDEYEVYVFEEELKKKSKK